MDCLHAMEQPAERQEGLGVTPRQKQERRPLRRPRRRFTPRLEHRTQEPKDGGGGAMRDRLGGCGSWLPPDTPREAARRVPDLCVARQQFRDGPAPRKDITAWMTPIGSNEIQGHSTAQVQHTTSAMILLPGSDHGKPAIHSQFNRTAITVSQFLEAGSAMNETGIQMPLLPYPGRQAVVSRLTSNTGDMQYRRRRQPAPMFLQQLLQEVSRVYLGVDSPFQGGIRFAWIVQIDPLETSIAQVKQQPLQIPSPQVLSQGVSRGEPGQR